MSSFNKVGGRYGMHSGSAKFKNLQVDQNMWVQGNSIGPVSPGKTWFVDSGVNANGTGASWDLAFKTIAAAISAAGEEGDTIYVAPGDYSISTALAVNKDNLSIIGLGRMPNDYKALIYSSAAINLMNIDANCVSIIGLGFSTAGGAGIGIDIAATTASYKTYIANCRFDGWAQGTYGVNVGNTADAPDCTIENCWFNSWATACINANATRDTYRYNTFFVAADTSGIIYVPTTGTRPMGLIDNNYFCGVTSATTAAISFTGAPTVGTVMLMNNLLAGSWNVTIEASACDPGCLNYEGSTTGGTLIDCNSSA